MTRSPEQQTEINYKKRIPSKERGKDFKFPRSMRYLVALAVALGLKIDVARATTKPFSAPVSPIVNENNFDVIQGEYLDFKAKQTIELSNVEIASFSPALFSTETDSTFFEQLSSQLTTEGKFHFVVALDQIEALGVSPNSELGQQMSRVLTILNSNNLQDAASLVFFVDTSNNSGKAIVGGYFEHQVDNIPAGGVFVPTNNGTDVVTFRSDITTPVWVDDHLPPEIRLAVGDRVLMDGNLVFVRFNTIPTEPSDQEPPLALLTGMVTTENFVVIQPFFNVFPRSGNANIRLEPTTQSPIIGTLTSSTVNTPEPQATTAPLDNLSSLDLENVSIDDFGIVRFKNPNETAEWVLVNTPEGDVGWVRDDVVYFIPDHSFDPNTLVNFVSSDLGELDFSRSSSAANGNENVDSLRNSEIRREIMNMVPVDLKSPSNEAYELLENAQLDPELFGLIIDNQGQQQLYYPGMGENLEDGIVREIGRISPPSSTEGQQWEVILNTNNTEDNIYRNSVLVNSDRLLEIINDENFAFLGADPAPRIIVNVIDVDVTSLTTHTQIQEMYPGVAVSPKVTDNYAFDYEVYTATDGRITIVARISLSREDFMGNEDDAIIFGLVSLLSTIDANLRSGEHAGFSPRITNPHTSEYWAFYSGLSPDGDGSVFFNNRN